MYSLTAYRRNSKAWKTLLVFPTLDSGSGVRVWWEANLLWTPRILQILDGVMNSGGPLVSSHSVDLLWDSRKSICSESLQCYTGLGDWEGGQGEASTLCTLTQNPSHLLWPGRVCPQIPLYATHCGAAEQIAVCPLLSSDLTQNRV